MQSRDEQAKQAKKMIKDIYDEGVAEINGREYKFTVMNHKKRRKVFAFYTGVAASLHNNDYSFLALPEFEPVEAIVNDSVTFNDSLLSRLGDKHWEEYACDYLAFIGVALAVISYPFLAGKDTD